jgi:hypothetical protein
MLISAKYEKDKMVATHVQKIDEISRYCNDLAKDPSNGFTKDRNMRRIGSFPTFTLLAYDQAYPGWYKRVTENKDFKDKQRAWKEFLASDYAKPFMMVDKMKH